jgi:hypothetical protein
LPIGLLSNMEKTVIPGCFESATGADLQVL